LEDDKGFKYLKDTTSHRTVRTRDSGMALGMPARSRMAVMVRMKVFMTSLC